MGGLETVHSDETSQDHSDQNLHTKVCKALL